MSTKRIARVIKDWRTVYADPLTVHAGERLTLGKRDDEWPGWIWVTTEANKNGWMPGRLIESHGPTGTALADYDARELEVCVGGTLTLHAEESGWHWATASDGRTGWVPASHVELHDR